MRFRLLRGVHIGPGPEGCECEGCDHDRNHRKKDKDGNYIEGTKGHTYRKGDVLESDWDLCGHNTPGNPSEVNPRGIKFERLPEEYPLSTITESDSVKMRKEQEKAVARREQQKARKKQTTGAS